MKTLNAIIGLALFLCPLILPTQAAAQDEKDLLAQLVEEDRQAIEALVLYPSETRVAILEASLHPEALIKLESMQSKTSASFKELMEPYPRETQELIWELTRFPDLLPLLVEEGRYSEEQLRQYPEKAQEQATQARLYNFPLLVETNELLWTADDAFRSLISPYDLKAQEAFKQLVQLPEVLSILTENLRLTVLVGDIYRKDPDWLLQKADSLSLVVARDNAKEMEDWKNSLEEDSEARTELTEISEDFSREYGYDDLYYTDVDDDMYYDSEEKVVVLEKHYYYYYPYWTGYPYWYDYPRWRPFPYWYDCGFYVRPGGVIVIFNLPSYYFTHWYFYHPNHHYRYSRLSARFVRHYYGHRYSNSSITSSVTVWQRRNKDVITDNWMRDDRNLPDRFKEYGKFESSRTKYNQKNPERGLSQREYLERNTRNYPKLEREKKEVVRPDAGRKDVPKTQREQPRPKTEVRPPRTRDPEIKRRTSPKPPPKVDKGKEHHRATWEKERKATKPPVRKKVETKKKDRNIRNK